MKIFQNKYAFVFLVTTLMCVLFIVAISWNVIFISREWATNRPVKKNIGSWTGPLDTNLNNVIARYNPTPRPLLYNAIPVSVHYLWCSTDVLRFSHYLAIKSAIRTLQPTSVTFHFITYPLIDRYNYNRWIEELRRDYSFFEIVKLANNSKMCIGSIKSRKQSVIELLNKKGGIYIGENTWTLQLPVEHLLLDFEDALVPHTLEGYMIVRKGAADESKPNNEHIQRTANNKTMRFKAPKACVPMDYILDQDSPYPNCLVVSPGITIAPAEIMDRNDPFGRIARTIYYGTSNTPKPVPNDESLVPNIAHVIWIGTRKLTFMVYLTILSSLFVLNVDKLYIHHDNDLGGPYWEKLRALDSARDRIIPVFIENPHFFFVRSKRKGAFSLSSNWIRTEVLIKYGGFYTDTDAVWVKPFTREQRMYDMVAAFDWVRWSPPFPNCLNLGVTYAKINAPFLRLLREEMRQSERFIAQDGYVGTKMPYKVYERYPETILINPHLQVICYNAKCHPTWEEGYYDERKNHAITGSLRNWTQVVHAFHWTYPDPVSYKNESVLLSSKGVFADVGKMILAKAGLI